ncbi:MAG: SAM-dependent chlorinase/fluorinase [Acidimicrobiaceae bacterium]|nr:SAM-dependent chlorinase/fluorinase [Acidimicrobiaceae bacterium]
MQTHDKKRSDLPKNQNTQNTRNTQGCNQGYNTVSFLSDFGLADEFVGVVHGVIVNIAPRVRIVDITHGITPHDVRAGGLALARAASYLPAGLVLAVVDPGVGTSRRAVAVEVGDGSSILVGPDNGLLGPAVALVGGAGRAVELTNKQYQLPGRDTLGHTFDGRDVFAPAAAHLCMGVPLQNLGPSIDPAALVPGVLPVSYEDGEDLVAEVLWVDRFGNCQLNLSAEDIARFGSTIQISTAEELCSAECSPAYGAIPKGRVGLVIDSTGLASLAMCGQSAAVKLKLHEGAPVRLRHPTDGQLPNTETSSARKSKAVPVSVSLRADAAV